MSEIVLFHDTFNKAEVSAVPWNLTVANAATLTLTSSANEFLTGGQAMKLTSGTSSATEVHRFVGRPSEVANLQVCTLEMTMASMDENPSNFAIYNGFRDDANWYRAKLLHVNSTNVWSYQDSAGNQQTLLTRDTAESSTFARWHQLSVSVNVMTGRWVGLEVDEQDFSSTVKGLALRSTADTAVPWLLDFAVEVTNTATPGVIIFDEIKAYLS